MNVWLGQICWLWKSGPKRAPRSLKREDFVSAMHWLKHENSSEGARPLTYKCWRTMRLWKYASLETFHTKNERELWIKNSSYGTVFFALGPHGIIWGETTGYVTYRKICVCSIRIFWHLKHKKRARIANKNIKLLQLLKSGWFLCFLLFSSVGPSKYKTCSSHPFELKFSEFIYFLYLRRILLFFSKKSQNSL